MSNDKINYFENELKISDIINFFKKQKITLMIGIMFSMLISIIYFQLKSDVFECSFIIGKEKQTIVNQENYYFSLNKKTVELRNIEKIYFDDYFLNQEIIDRLISKMKLNRSILSIKVDNDFLVVKIITKYPEKDLKVLEKMYSEIVRVNSQRISKMNEKKYELIKKYEKQNMYLEKKIFNYNNLVNKLREKFDCTKIDTLEKCLNIIVNMYKLEKIKKDNENYLKQLKNFNIKALKTILKPSEKKIKEKKIFIMIVLNILGIVLSMFFVFLVDNIKKTNK